MEYQSLANKAKAVLDGNWTGKYTQPAKGLYPYQWSWDSGFISYGYAHYNQDRAETEIRSLFKGQWTNGLLPHIVFHKKMKGYAPGPEFWHTDVCPYASRKPVTSGIVQPPVHASAVWHIYKHAEDKTKAFEFLKEMLPKLTAWHEYLYRDRDPEGEGLVFIRHPWESGQDNSPIWDEPLSHFKVEEKDIPDYERLDIKLVKKEERPSKIEYDRYVYLVKIFQDLQYSDQRIYQKSPFIIQDVLFNSLLCQSDRDLARIADKVGQDSGQYNEWAEKTAAVMNKKLWNKEHGFFFDYDMKNGQLIESFVASGLTPLYAGILSKKQAELISKNLKTHCFCSISEGAAAVQSYDEDQPGYSAVEYWRGPIWINLNWLIYHGARQYGFLDHAEHIHLALMTVPEHYGFCEYYDVHAGRCLGSKDFSWSAALVLDLIEEETAASDT